MTSLHSPLTWEVDKRSGDLHITVAHAVPSNPTEPCQSCVTLKHTRERYEARGEKIQQLRSQLDQPCQSCEHHIRRAADTEEALAKCRASLAEEREQKCADCPILRKQLSTSRECLACPVLQRQLETLSGGPEVADLRASLRSKVQELAGERRIKEGLQANLEQRIRQLGKNEVLLEEQGRMIVHLKQKASVLSEKLSCARQEAERLKVVIPCTECPAMRSALMKAQTVEHALRAESLVAAEQLQRAQQDLVSEKGAVSEKTDHVRRQVEEKYQLIVQHLTRQEEATQGRIQQLQRENEELCRQVEMMRPSWEHWQRRHAETPNTRIGVEGEKWLQDALCSFFGDFASITNTNTQLKAGDLQVRWDTGVSNVPPLLLTVESKNSEVNGIMKADYMRQASEQIAHCRAHAGLLCYSGPLGLGETIRILHQERLVVVGMCREPKNLLAGLGTAIILGSRWLALQAGPARNLGLDAEQTAGAQRIVCELGTLLEGRKNALMKHREVAARAYSDDQHDTYRLARTVAGLDEHTRAALLPPSLAKDIVMGQGKWLVDACSGKTVATEPKGKRKRTEYTAGVPSPDVDVEDVPNPKARWVAALGRIHVA